MKFSETIYLDSTENDVTMSSLLPGLRHSFYAETEPDVKHVLLRIAETGRNKYVPPPFIDNIWIVGATENCNRNRPLNLNAEICVI